MAILSVFFFHFRPKCPTLLPDGDGVRGLTSSGDASFGPQLLARVLFHHTAPHPQPQPPLHFLLLLHDIPDAAVHDILDAAVRDLPQRVVNRIFADETRPEVGGSQSSA